MGKKTKWYHATLLETQIISDTKLTLRFKVEDEPRFEFIPGQFVTMDLPLGDRRLQRWRSYSIANLPNDENYLDFAIGKLNDGAASQYFFEELKRGDQIKFKGPEGNFVIPKKLDRPIVMIATGTGVVPFISMIRKIIKENLPFDKIHLIYGSRYEKDLLYKDELKSYQESHSDFNLDYILSREDQWAGPKGYVHKIYKEKYTKKDSHTLFLLCGWSSMIDEAVANLFSLVVSPPEQIKYELYG